MGSYSTVTSETAKLWSLRPFQFDEWQNATFLFIFFFQYCIFCGDFSFDAKLLPTLHPHLLYLSPWHSCSIRCRVIQLNLELSWNMYCILYSIYVVQYQLWLIDSWRAPRKGKSFLNHPNFSSNRYNTS